jgi:hypothetical protein
VFPPNGHFVGLLAHSLDRAPLIAALAPLVLLGHWALPMAAPAIWFARYIPLFLYLQPFIGLATPWDAIFHFQLTVHFR